MKKEFKKSSPEKIEMIRSLYRTGLSFSEIGRRLKLDPSTVFYWIKKKKENLSQRKQLSIAEQKKISIFNQSEISPRTKRRRLKEKCLEEERKKLKENECCIVCKQIKKDQKFIKTLYCSFACYEKEYHRIHSKSKKYYE